MERKLGEVFTYNGKTYQVIKGCGCIGCDFVNRCYNFLYKIHGSCSNIYRKDNISVVFKEVNNMEIKNNQLTIDIPEGMEIDLENSDLAKGIIKFKANWLTLEQLYKLAKDNVYFTNRDAIKDFCNSKIVVLANFMDIAKYFNGDWKYDVTKEESIGYVIVYDGSINAPNYRVRKIEACSNIYFGNVVFKNKADAQYVIDNPNFRIVLDKIFKV